LRKNCARSEPIERQLINLIKKEKPQSIEQLVHLAKEKFSLKEKEALDHIIKLLNQEKIRLTEEAKVTPRQLRTYLQTSETYWFWTTILLALTTVIIVFTIPENAYPIVYIRYILGSIFVLWLPGYTLIKALFPTKHELDTIERLALSIGLSLAIVPIVGLLLNYTPWGIRLTPITLSLLALITCFATAALIREHQLKINQANP